MSKLEEFKRDIKKDIHGIREEIKVLTERLGKLETDIEQAKTLDELGTVMRNSDVEDGLEYIALL